MPNLVPIEKENPKTSLSPLQSPLQSSFAKLTERLRDPELDARLLRLEHKNLNELGYDPFGYHPDFVRQIAPLAQWVHRRYFRTEVFGIEKVPERGRVLLIANHSGQLPVDAMVLAISMLIDAPEPRLVRGMVERFVPRLPWASVFMARGGQILGDPDNCRRLLENEEAVMVFPEGARGISKPSSQAYKLTEFGYGFMRLAIETNTPIVPVGIIGAEEQYVRIGNIKPMAKRMNIPAVPMFLFGWAPVPGGLLPLPVKYRLHFGDPLVFEGSVDDDDAIVGRKVKAVKSAINGLIQEGLEQRQAVFW
jgi:1-acyl-sn-glycerol-3-phosphate acyltransferase